MSSILDSAQIGTVEYVETPKGVSSFQESFILTGVTGSGGNAKVDDALSNASIPDFGDALTGHTSCKVVQRSVRILSSTDTTATMSVTVRWSEDDQVEGFRSFVVSGHTEQRMTEVDYYGVPITVSYTYPDNDPLYAGQTQTQWGQVSTKIQMCSIQARGNIATTDPQLYSAQYASAVNSNTWRHMRPTTWSCEKCGLAETQLTDSTGVWTLDFEFLCNPYGWEQSVFFIDPRTGMKPPDLVSGVGWKTPVLRPRADFSELFV